MQLPLYLKWSQARNRRSMLWLYLVLGLTSLLTLWSLPKLINLLVFCLTLLSNAETRRWLWQTILTTGLILGIATLIGGTTRLLWTVLIIRIWQLPQRYAVAIDRLSDDQIEHRLESIQTLKQIAKLALTEHRTITKTLADFVQERASIYASYASCASYASVDQSDEQREPFALPEQQPIALDIQAALTVIGHKPFIDRVMGRLIDKACREETQPINMGLTHLCKARLSHANLQEVNFYRTNLQQASLQNINLQQANLQSANLKQCNLDQANLKAADLQNIDLQEATLYKINLQDANLYNANLQGVNLCSANLQRTSLQATNLREANLYGVNLQGAFLYQANLQETSLQAANLQEAFLSEVNLQGANLYKANLQGATGLTTEQLSQAKLCMTVLPDGSISHRDCSELGCCDRPPIIKPMQTAAPAAI